MSMSIGKFFTEMFEDRTADWRRLGRACEAACKAGVIGDGNRRDLSDGDVRGSDIEDALRAIAWSSAFGTPQEKEAAKTFHEELRGSVGQKRYADALHAASDDAHYPEAKRDSREARKDELKAIAWKATFGTREEKADKALKKDVNAVIKHQRYDDVYVATKKDMLLERAEKWQDWLYFS